MRFLVLAFALLGCTSRPTPWEPVAYKYDMNKTAYVRELGHVHGGTLVGIAFKWSDSPDLEPATPGYGVVRCSNRSMAVGENMDPSTWKDANFQVALPGSPIEAFAHRVCD